MEMTLDMLHDLLKAASLLLGEAGSEIRESALASDKEHVRNIGRAMGHIQDVQAAIYALRPDLEPPHLREHRLDPEASRKYGELIIKAYEVYEGGTLEEAVALFTEYLATSPPEFFRQLAAEQVARLQQHTGGTEA